MWSINLKLVCFILTSEALCIPLIHEALSILLIHDTHSILLIHDTIVIVVVCPKRKELLFKLKKLAVMLSIIISSHFNHLPSLTMDVLMNFALGR